MQSAMKLILIAAFGLIETAGAQTGTWLEGRLTYPYLTAQAVPDATVSWSIAGSGTTPNPANTTVTDANGYFAFEIPVAATTQLQVTINANAYNLLQFNVQIAPGAPVTLFYTIMLTPKSTSEFGTVSGNVQNTSGLAIPNATVSILGAGALLTTTTDSNGNYQLSNVGFNSNLMLQASSTHSPCIAPTQVPLVVSTTAVTANVQAPRVLSLTVGCPPPQPPLGEGMSPIKAALTVDPTVKWQQADGAAIASPAEPTWNAGRVNDILRFPPGQGILVASDEGGVWSIAEDSTRTATPLSNKWPSVTISSLALGTGGPQDVYAGTYPYGDAVGGKLWETDTSQSQPLMSWSALHTPCGSINKILVVAATDVILLACDTGLWWSQIPPPPSVHGTYHWLRAQPSAIGGQAFSGLALGFSSPASGLTNIAASTWGGTPPGIIYTGSWSGGNLFLSPTAVPPSGPLSRTSLASCASNPQIMFAVASDSGGQRLAAVWQSTNGGSSWTPVNVPPNPGLQGDSNQAVAISPDCSTVAVGWQTGTFYSFNAGSSWTQLTAAGEYNDLHVDIHGLTFDPAVPGVLWIGSSGGVASTAGLTNGSPPPPPATESDWNQQLFNLEFYDGGGSATFSGFVGGASQDNGILSTSLPAAWQHANDCGGALECWGGLALFAEQGPSLELNDLFVDADQLPPISSTAASFVTSPGQGIVFNGETALQISPPCAPCSAYTLNIAAPVRNAAESFASQFLSDNTQSCSVANAAGQCMFAVGEMSVYGAGDGVYGLFADAGFLPGGFSGAHWEPLEAGPGLWSGVTAIAPTYDGTSIFVGNDLGQIYRLVPPTDPTCGSSAAWCATLLSVAVPADCSPSCPVTGLYAFNPNIAFATYGHHFMVWKAPAVATTAVQWIESDAGLPTSHNFLALTASDPNIIYIASSAGVFDTTDGGNTWMNASSGLPLMIPGATGFEPPAFLGSHDYLQLVNTNGGVAAGGNEMPTHLYLASFGRSVWHTVTNIPPPPAQEKSGTIKIEIWTGNDNAESWSEIDGLLVLSDLSFQDICLKPSSVNEPGPGNCSNGSGTEWPNGADVAQTLSLKPHEILDGAILQITLTQHNTWFEGQDNWDIQGISVTTTDSKGSVLPLLTLTQQLPYISGVNNCIARLKGLPGVTNVWYALSADDPLNYNLTYPFTNFGPTPPGSCPQ